MITSYTKLIKNKVNYATHEKVNESNRNNITSIVYSNFYKLYIKYILCEGIRPQVSFFNFYIYFFYLFYSLFYLHNYIPVYLQKMRFK